MTDKTITTAQRILYGYWRSSASYRVRIALNLKSLAYDHQGVHLVKAEHKDQAFIDKNSQGLVPLYEEKTDSSVFQLSQSLAIMDYLEEAYPEIALLPTNPQQKAIIKAASQIIACEIHPLDNLRVLQYLENTLGVASEDKMTWYRHWVATGFTALEAQLDNILGNNPFSLGDRAGYLEAVIVPQVYNANRFGCPMDDYPKIVALNEACLQLPEFIQASPEQQPDAQA